MQNLTPNEKRDLILSVGTHRAERRLSPIEVAILFQKVLDTEENLDDIADFVQLTGTMVRRFIYLLSLPLEIQTLVGWGTDASTISFTAAHEIARLSSQEEQTLLAKSVLENQLSSSEVRQVIQIRKRSEKTVEEALEDVLSQRTVIDKRHVIIGALVSDKLKNRLSGMSQTDRNTLFEKVTNDRGLGEMTKGIKLGVDNFAFVGDEALRSTLVALPGGFENAITDYLLLELGLLG